MPRQKVTPPRRVRIATGAVPWRDAHGHEIVHVGHSAVLLASPANSTGRELLVITSASRGLVPGGICVPDDQEFAALAHAIASPLRRADDRGDVDLTGWLTGPPTEITSVDLRVRPVAISSSAVAGLVRLAVGHQPADRGARVVDLASLRRLAAPLTRAALVGDAAQVARALDRLVGAGPGATPTGDDVIVGVLAALDAAAGTSVPSREAAGARQQVCTQLGPRLWATTRASRHDLTAAVHGQFSEHVHALVAVLADPTRVATAFAAAAAWGATSGVDLACGVALAARTVLRHSELTPRRPASDSTNGRRSA
jgi:hypothetical protein